MNFEPQTHVADLASRHPSTIAVLQRHGIDFCCGGRRPLVDAAREQGLDWARLAEELETAVATPAEDGRSWTDAALPELIRHILERYHAKLRQELPRLGAMAEKVEAVHGARHPELAEVRRTFDHLRGELEMHTAKEEQILFPLIEELAAAEILGYAPEPMHCGSVSNPIRVMEMEHDGAGQALATLRSLTGGFTPPEDACNTYRGLLHGLAELEADTHHHIHLENNILFPRAAELEHRLRSGTAVSAP